MNFREQLKAKIEAQAALVKAAKDSNRALSAEEQVSFDALEVEIKALENSIQAENTLAARNALLTTPVNTPVVTSPNTEAPKLFKSLVEQLCAVKAVVTEGRVDERLIQLNRYNNAVLGGNEGSGADGGFGVQTDFAGLMVDSAVKDSQIIGLVDSYQITDGSNSVKWVDIDETSIASTVFGGVQVYWAAEAAEVVANNPKLSEKELKLEKLMGLAYATYELENDSSFINQLYTKAFTTAIRRELESCIISGTGVGKPLGILKSGSLVQVAKEGGQIADSIVWENISKMYNRILDKSKAAWVMHPDCHEQLDFLSFPVGVGGVPVYLPATQIGTVDVMRGKPILDTDNCSALGDLGDINFVDLSQYMLAYKGGVDAATSIHVQFLTAQNCFRFIFRANGMPKKTSALTIKNSAKQRSSFVSLAERA